MSTPLRTRILLADDHTIVRRGLRMVLETAPDLEVVAEAGDGIEAVEQGLREDVDLAILDGYVLKTAASCDLAEACRAAMRGEPFLYPPAVQGIMRDYLERAAHGDTTREEPLTERELEILKLVAEAHTNEQIAELLVISPRTVERHRENIMGKLGMRDRVQLTRYAIRRGLVEP